MEEEPFVGHVSVGAGDSGLFWDALAEAVFSAFNNTAFHIREKVKSLRNLQSLGVLCIFAGMGAAACGEARKASSPGTEFVLMHLSQNPGHAETKAWGKSRCWV